MTDGERIEYVYGRLDALQGMVLALIANSHNPKTLKIHAHQIWETRAGGHLHANVSEPFLTGVEEGKQQMFDVLGKSIELYETLQQHR
jgi:hypothetical protein